MCCPWWSITSNKQVLYIYANYGLERNNIKFFSKQPNKWVFRTKQLNSAKKILNKTWNVSLFCVLKKELDARSCIKKCWMWCYFKKHWKRWRLLGLGQVNNDTFLNLELELLVQWCIWTKTTYPVQLPAYGNAGVWVSHCCRNLLPNSAFCWLIPCVLPVSTKEMQHCHFNAAFWPALTSSFSDLRAEQRLSKKLDLEHI